MDHMLTGEGDEDGSQGMTGLHIQAVPSTVPSQMLWPLATMNCGSLRPPQ